MHDCLSESRVCVRIYMCVWYTYNNGVCAPVRAHALHVYERGGYEKGKRNSERNVWTVIAIDRFVYEAVHSDDGYTMTFLSKL